MKYIGKRINQIYYFIDRDPNIYILFEYQIYIYCLVTITLKADHKFHISTTHPIVPGRH